MSSRAYTCRQDNADCGWRGGGLSLAAGRLCDAAGFKGPLYECSVAGNKAAGALFKAMLEAGASEPWPDTLEKLTGTREMDASAIIEYFQPLLTWLAEQNKGQQCGWT